MKCAEPMKSMLKALRAVAEGLKNEALAFPPDSQCDKSQTQPSLPDMERSEIAAHALRGPGPSSARDEITLAPESSSELPFPKTDEEPNRASDHNVAKLSSSALTFSPAKDQVGVYLSADSSWVRYGVFGHGCGIEEKHHACLRERVQRQELGGKSRWRELLDCVPVGG